MQSGPDPMSAPASFATRRPHASNLPSFELPPPPLAGLQQKFQAYPNLHTTQPSASTAALTSVGNLLTPPTNSSADGLSPLSAVANGSQHMQNSAVLQPYTPASSAASMSYPATTPYGFQSNSQHYPNNHSHSQGRGLFSPSLNSIVRGTNSPASEVPAPPPYDSYHHYNSSSMPMSAPSLPAVHTHQQHQSQQQQHQQMMGGPIMPSQTPVSASSVTHPSPVPGQDGFPRPPPTPTYHQGSHSSSTPQQATFPYSSGPSPIQQSPVNGANPMSRPSPVNGQHGQMPPLHSHPAAYPHRPYTYPLPGPVLSNVNNPAGGLALVGANPHGMPLAYNSGHAAMHQMYVHHPAQPAAQNDRPFRCDQCPQSFNRNHDLKRHKRIHLAVKPFPCGHCDKSFSRKDALKRHVLVKGCGKARATSEVKELDGSASPDSKSDADASPVVSTAA